MTLFCSHQMTYQRVLTSHLQNFTLQKFAKSFFKKQTTTMKSQKTAASPKFSQPDLERVISKQINALPFSIPLFCRFPFTWSVKKGRIMKVVSSHTSMGFVHISH